jgi:hypothetical protein
MKGESLTEIETSEIKSNERMAADGLGPAYRDQKWNALPADITPDAVENDLTFWLCRSYGSTTGRSKRGCFPL